MQINTTAFFISPGSGKLYQQVITQTITEENFVIIETSLETSQTTFPPVP